MYHHHRLGLGLTKFCFDAWDIDLQEHVKGKTV